MKGIGTMGELKHGDARRSGHHRLYSIRKGMLERCYNPNNNHYKDYGGKGVKVCEEWKESYLSFKNWALNSEYEDGLTIDRIDGDGDYCPENCRWASAITQANNKKNIPKYEYQGEIHSISEWSRILNVSRGLLKDRITKLNWDIEKAFTTPPKKKEDIEYNGEVHTWSEWSNITGISKDTLQGRHYDMGWSIERTLTTPVQKHNTTK